MCCIRFAPARWAARSEWQICSELAFRHEFGAGPGAQLWIGATDFSVDFNTLQLRLRRAPPASPQLAARSSSRAVCATPGRKLRFGLFKVRLRRCLREHLS